MNTGWDLGTLVAFLVVVWLVWWNVGAQGVD